jgi:hypothetical protein
VKKVFDADPAAFVIIPSRMRRARLLFLIVVVLVVVILFSRHAAPPLQTPTINITTQPATQPTTAPVILAPKIATYIDVVRSNNPLIPATQPLSLPVDLSDAAHIILHDPAYLDPLGHIWITRPDAPPTEESLRNPVDPSEHLISDIPVFVHWSANDNGDWSASVITRRAAGGYDIISSLDRKPFASDRSYRWDCAFSWDGKIVVPTDTGVSVFEVEPKVRESFHALPGMTSGSTAPIAMLDSRGVLAWAPWENGHPGSHGASRFVDGNWTDLSNDQWPEKIIQLIPLLDGSILQIIAGDGDTVSLAIAPLESTDIDAHHVADLVDGLSDPDGDKRQAAFDELSRYGPGLWPILEKVTDQPPEARVRIKQLLRAKIAPALNGMTLVDNRLTVAHRQSDGTVLFFAPTGVKIPNAQRDPDTVSPAWVTVHPSGRIDRPLPNALIVDQRPDAPNLNYVHDDWLVCDDAGVRRFLGNALVPLLKPQEITFSRILGIDRRGRWLFRERDLSNSDMLIIDPTILDPTPRLPVWTINIPKGSVGWTDDDYPAIKRGGAWALKADAWEALPDSSKLLTLLPSPTTTPSTQSTALPLLVMPDGTKYSDGRTSLIAVDKTGKTTSWPLPSSAVGSIDPTLICSPDGLLFLFNQPGRVLRIKPTPTAPQPFELQATFTADIPNTDHPTRIWLDPLGRIDMVYDGTVLVVMFPSGHIPPGISQMMLDDPH